ncbi:cation:proton antiporter domain-containing protein [Cellulomonas bogoriensis]|uniref:Sodium:proton exchanger n=1 Tax=Cellulomonas bogoriensis 69B4 = DSM 16987 TaxID=1386082 RepID=A0A0A0BYV5_9CELL|nr:cation:proton antiporter [Cellulomonas bogoriensis]KGM12872.1 sodium:proton exchanger [Cellulomonas bogoriensis 69B4 = DSM 16987]
MDLLPQILLMLGLAVVATVVLHRLHVPSTIGYLLVGVLLGPGTIGPVIDRDDIEALAEFGIVFLLFTIGLSFSLPELRSLRRQVPLLGTGQVVLSTAVVMGIAWLGGLGPAAAFVVGAVFAQSSTTIISRQLTEQGEENSRPGRLGVAMSVFQDVTAVPFLVIIPVLGTTTGAVALGAELGTALGLAALAVLVVFVLGRRLLGPLFRFVARRHSAELFTLTVLLVVLASAWTTSALGLSLAFGAFLAGMTLGETEFRHQVESSIRPFRDVLLGLFFIAIGMLFDPSVFPGIWHWALLGAVGLVAVKVVLVAVLAHAFGLDRQAAARTGLLLGVGGEFGLALLAIALTSGAIDSTLNQVGLTAVLLSMVMGTFLIRFNRPLASMITGATPRTRRDRDEGELSLPAPVDLSGHVVVCGFGRIGQGVVGFLRAEGQPYVAVDLDAERVRVARAAGEPVFFADAGQPDVLDALGVARARLVVVAHDDVSSALTLLAHLRTVRPDLPVMVRTRDETHVQALRAAGAFEVVPETLEAGLAMASQVLVQLDVPVARVVRHVQEQRTGRYRLVRELFPGEGLTEDRELPGGARLRPLTVSAVAGGVGLSIADVEQVGVTVAALLRAGERLVNPGEAARLHADDVLVLHGDVDALHRAEALIKDGRQDPRPG